MRSIEKSDHSPSRLLRTSLLVLVTSSLVVACGSQESGTVASGSGGKTTASILASGGATSPASQGTGGTSLTVVGTGGTTSLGGTTSTGGTSSLGGTIGAGGISFASGGAQITGGSLGSGGRTVTGGTVGTGGATSSGGTTATGGNTSTGGTVGTGGRSAAGGTSATGGRTGTGGATATGGSATGGAASGGAPGTGGGSSAGSITCGTHTISTAGYTLAWSDEFDGSAVDTSKWTVLNTADNTNGNLEYYSPNNMTVSGGYLNITARQESVGGRSYTSGAMGSYGKYTFQYGKVVGCIKMPTPAKGYWPAFWMIGNYNNASWPTSGEIDILENIGTSTVFGTLHWAANNTMSQGSTTTTVDSFHAYEMIWDAQHIAFLVDDVQYFTADITSAAMAAMRSQYYFWINFAIGGPTSWPGAPTSSTPFPALMQIDYVRVYQ